MITEKQKDRIVDNIRIASFIDREINLPKLPKGWTIEYPHMGFCKVCHKSIVLMKALKSPGGRSYYHFKCILKSRLFIKQLARR